jgi:hypothetical protein
MLVDTKAKSTYVDMRQFPNNEKRFAVTLSSKGDYRQDQLGIVDLDAKTFTVVDDAIGKKVDFYIIAIDEGWVVYQVNYESSKLNDKLKAYVLDGSSLLTLYETPAYFQTLYSNEDNTVIVAEDRTARYYTSYKTSKYELSRFSLPSGDKEQLLTKVGVSLQYIDGGDFIYYLDNTNITKPRIKEAYYKSSVAGTFEQVYVGVKYPEPPTQAEIPDSEKGLASPTGVHRIWVETRDSKGRLVLDSSDKLVPEVNPALSAQIVVRWLDDRLVIVYGSSSGSGTADYLVDVETGNFEKIVSPFKYSYSKYGYGI